MHNRSHLLTLGSTSQQTVEETTNQADSSSTSVSIGDIDDLLSLDSDNSEKDNMIEDLTSCDNTARVKGLVNEDSYSDAFENYRQNFPEIKSKKGDLELPEIYKEQLLRDSSTNVFTRIWREMGCKPKPRKNKSLRSFRFTVNALYNNAELGRKEHVELQTDGYEDMDELVSAPDSKCMKRNSIGRNIAIYNTLNSRTNLHEEPIYECSEDELSVYNNPIYFPAEPLPNHHDPERKKRYFDFHTNRDNQQNGFFRDQDEADIIYEQISCCRRRQDAHKRKLRTEKHIIRHIRVRIMLTLRLRKFALQSGDVRNTSRNSERFVKERIKDVHEEQRRIGSGRNSMKIQNMR